jgi:hypothetical protein
MRESRAVLPIGDIPDNRPTTSGPVPDKLRFDYTARVQDLLTLAILDISRRSRDQLKSALNGDHTFKRYDPEFFGLDGVGGMNLIDLLVMVLTWKSQADLHIHDSINSAIKVCRKRYGFGDELEKILRNTVFDIDNLEAIEVADVGDI